MEFWGVEVKAGEPLKVEPGEDMILHLSQASLGEVKKDKGNESVVLYVKIDGQKLVIGTLSAEKCAHISYDLVFEKEFELSHNWKNGSVYFCGYRSFVSDEPSGFSDSESDEEGLPLKPIENGKPEPKVEESKPAADKAKAVAKPDSSANKQKVKVVEPSKEDEDDDDDSDEEDENDDSEEDESDDEDMLDAGGDSDDEDEDEDDESSDEEDEATPKKADVGKKRPAADSATKTPVEKKAKLVTPQKTGGADGKKGGGHTATPHPSKQAGKTPANSDKKQQTPKSGGQFSCKTCNKSFNSDNGLQSHTKAKHSAGK